MKTKLFSVTVEAINDVMVFADKLTISQFLPFLLCFLEIEIFHNVKMCVCKDFDQALQQYFVTQKVF